MLDCARREGVEAAETELAQRWLDSSGGTLFIREVGNLPPGAQTRLVQLLAGQDRVASPVEAGGVRLIGSSSQNLIEKVKSGAFREDLFYRISVFPIWLPPLRERPDDLTHLVWHYVARFGAEEGKRIQSIDPRASAMLRAYSWPGNVRQLETILYRAVILAESERLQPDDLPHLAAQLRSAGAEAAHAPMRYKTIYRGPAMIGLPLTVNTVPAQPQGGAPLGIPALTEEGEIRPLTAIEADLIRLALGHYRGHITEVARRLGIGRSTLYRKMKEFGLDMRHNSL